MPVINLRQVALHADDLDRAVAFYRDVVGLDFVAKFDPPGLAFFRVGDTRLLLEGGAPASMLYLGVEDVAAEVERLRAAGVTIDTEPHVVFEDADGQFGSAGENEEMAFIRDSEGNLVGLSARR